MTYRLSLKVRRSGEESRVEVFERDIVKIGRLASAHLKLEDPKVSRIHAVIEVSGGGDEVIIIDMGSAEGTYVNGEKITKSKLKIGDEIRLGDTYLDLVPTEVQAAAATAGAAPEASVVSGGELAALAGLPLAEEGGVFDGSSAGDSLAAPAGAIPQASPAQPMAQSQAQVAESFTPAPMPSAEAMPAAQADGQAFAIQAVEAQPWAEVPPTPASLFSPGVVGNSLVPPIPTAPAPEWYDPFGEFANVVIEPEENVSKANHSLEIAVVWDDKLLDVRHYTEPKQVTLGESKKADIFVVSEGLPSNEFPLIRTIDGEYVLTYFAGLQGTMQKGSDIVPLSSLKGQADADFAQSFQFPLPLDSVTSVDYGGLSLQMRFVSRPRAIPGGPFQELNYNYLNVFLVSLFFHVGFFATMMLYPYETTSLEEDLFSSPNRFAQFIINPPEKKDNKLLARLLKGKDGESSAKHAGADGKAGKKDAKDTGKRMASKSDKPTNEMVVANKMNQLFGKDGGGGGVSSVFGGSLGGELVGALGGVTGAQVGDSYGMGGLGLRGHGPGGGGTSTTTFGVGSIGTRGRGGGTGGYGSGAGGLGGKKSRDIAVSQGTPVIMGSLDKEIIRRVIRENIAQIRYCYERELTRNPGLYGKIMVKFIIAATGRVSNASVQQTTMKNATVESCITRKVRGWRFPKPKGGGIVIVSYPFIFKQSS